MPETPEIKVTAAAGYNQILQFDIMQFDHDTG